MTKSRMLALTAVCLLAGCADFRACLDARLIASRNAYLARTSWGERGAFLCDGRKHHNDFRDGFYEGYLGVAAGNGGVAPLVPPEKYWAACYQDAIGREVITEWFAGYNEGAFAAAQDGIGELAEIPTWIGGACCDAQGRIFAHPEPLGPRKPRRGDPPVRATLPPPAVKTERPKNSEGNQEPPIADPTNPETPPPSDVEPLEKMLDPDAKQKRDLLPEEHPEPSKKDEGKTKVKTASKAGKPTAIEPRADAAMSSERWTRRDATKRETAAKPAAGRLGSKAADAEPVKMANGWTKPSVADTKVPTNPFVRPKPAPAYPVAPPVLQGAGLKASAAVEHVAQEVPKPAKALDDLDLPPPPRATTVGRIRSTPPTSSRAVEAASHQEDASVKERSSWSPAAKPATDVSPEAAPRAAEDGWGTPHDFKTSGGAKGAAGWK